jgi:hypothetical protein
MYLANITRDGISPYVRCRIIFARLSACRESYRGESPGTVELFHPASPVRACRVVTIRMKEFVVLRPVMFVSCPVGQAR